MILPGSQLAACNAELPVANIAFASRGAGGLSYNAHTLFSGSISIIMRFQAGISPSAGIVAEICICPFFSENCLLHMKRRENLTR